MSDYQANSHASREANAQAPPKKAEPKKKAERVVTGTVIRKKMPLHKRAQATFLGGNPREAVRKAFLETLVPRAKEAFLDSFYEGMDRMVLGEVRNTTARRGPGIFGNMFGPGPQVSSFVPYNAFGSGQPNAAQQAATQSIAARSGTNARPDFGQIIVPSRHEAEETIGKMAWFIQEYGFVSVADLCDMLGIQSADFTDEKYGWNDVRALGVKPQGGGYLLVLPYPQPLESQ